MRRRVTGNTSKGLWRQPLMPWNGDGEGTPAGNVSSGLMSGIAPITSREALAPWPQIDRYPIIVGTRVTFDYIDACMRTALVGYRMQMVDLLGEWMDHEPFGFGELRKLIIAIASAKYNVKPINDSPRAVEIADHVRANIAGCDNLISGLYNLAWWGFYSGVGANEIIYEKRYDGMQWIKCLQLIHSRRLAYPDWMLWDLHIWDQGLGGGLGSDPTYFGMRVADFPEKFFVLTPTLRGEYATREGLGRILSIYFALKRLVIRCTAQDFERFVKPWVIAYYSTATIATGKPRLANTQDIKMAGKAMQGAGAGSLSGLTMPDSVRIELLRAATAMSSTEFVAYLDQCISLVMQGQTFTSHPGRVGARAASETAKVDTDEIRLFCVKQVAEAMKACVVNTLVKLNFPGEEALSPLVEGVLEDRPTPKSILENATLAANVGAPVDGEAVCRAASVPLLELKDGRKVRLAPIAPVDGARIQPDGELEPLPEPAKGPAPSQRREARRLKRWHRNRHRRS